MKAAEDDDDLDLFGEETEEEKQAAAEREAQKKASAKKKESKSPLSWPISWRCWNCWVFEIFEWYVGGKSSVLLDVKPWDDETDMVKLEESVRSIEQDGLVWGLSKLVAVGFGIKKLQINLVIGMSRATDVVIISGTDAVAHYRG